MYRDFDPTRCALTVIGAHDVAQQLAGRERDLIDLAAQAYRLHSRGESRLPQSEYLRFPGLERERIIPKAGYLGGTHPTAGIKWVASFPDNVAKGLPRASAVIVLNSLENGRPTTVMEGSLISGQRTAAGAALAARVLHPRPRIERLGIVGCGPISSETLRFILADERPVDAVSLFDLDAQRTATLAAALHARGFRGDIRQASGTEELLAGCDLVVFGTSAVQASVDSLAACSPDTTVLHVSLRDLSVQAVEQADNLADDIDHVLQANTSVHRAEQQLGHRRFLRATLADVLEGRAPAREGGRPVVFHPFGLAALDLAFAQFVQHRCADAGYGAVVPDFLP